MRCNECGASSVVEETREQPLRFLTRRRRRCYNNHLFTTYEVHATVFKAVSSERMRYSLQGMTRRAARYARNLKAWAEWKASGESFTSLGKRYGLKRNSMSDVIRQIEKDRKDDT